MESRGIKTPDQRLRVFISSTMKELAAERMAVRDAIAALRLTPVLFELGARPHPPQALYRAYLEQSHIFVGIYGASYGWVAPGMDVSGLEDEYRLAAGKPKLIYIKTVGEREPRLERLIQTIRSDGSASYRSFRDADELRGVIMDDVALLLTEGFQQDAAAQPAESSRRSNLPVLVNSFVGRDAELQRLTTLVLEDGARLVTLTGPGGIGKSRLALEFTNSIRDRFPDGAHLVMLQSINDPALVPATIAQTLRIQELAGVSMEKVLVSEIADRRIVLVLDNFEHVLDAAEVVAELVAGCRHLVALATSRSPLRLRGEREVAVAPLEVPATAATDPSASAAVRLFLDRARAIHPRVVLGESDIAAIAEICRRLDGIPLAIELAAARLRLFAPRSMLQRLDDRFSLLRGGWRELPERHRTLRSTIDWSFDLLDEREKELFAQLSVFNGGFTLEAAERICDPEGRLDVLDTVASLVEKSLLQATVLGHEPRFSMLETIRRYGLDLFAGSDELAALRSRHAKFFVDLVAQARPRLRSSDQEAVLERLDEESGNLRSALGWLVDSGAADEAADAVWTLWHFWWLRDRLEEGMRLTGDVLAADDLSDLQRARAASSQGFMAFWRGDYGTALGHQMQALETFRKLSDGEGIAMAQVCIGIVSTAVVGPEDSLPRFAEALALLDAIGDEWSSVVARNAEGWVRLGLHGDMPPGMLEETVATAERLGTEIDHAMACGNLGAYRVRQGRLDEARRLLGRSLEVLLKYSVRNMATYTLDQVAELAVAGGDPEAAARFFGAADSIRLKVGAPLAPVHEAPRAEVIALGAERLGADRFELARAAGASLTFKAAMYEALEYCSVAPSS